MKENYNFVQGDRETISGTLIRNGSSIDLTGRSVTPVLVHEDDGRLDLVGTLSIDTPGTGSITLNLEQEDLGRTGEYELEFRIGGGADDPTTVPRDEPITITVRESNSLIEKVANTLSFTGGVSSAFGRTGDVIARSGDYTVEQITNALSTQGGTITGSLGVTESLSVGDNSEIVESAAGATVLRNNAGYPINIQLYPSGRTFLVSNTTETTISEQNTWYEIEGAWEAAHLNYLDHDGTGGLIYRGDVTSQTQYQIGGSYSSPSNNARYEIAVFKNGTVKDRTIIDFSPPRQNETISLPTIFGFTDSTEADMRHSVRIRCTTGTTNITVPSLSFTLRG